MHWDGTSWAIVPSPNPGNRLNIFWGIGTDGGGGVWAVGHYADRGGPITALFARWTGSAWEVVAPPGESNWTPTAVAGAAANDVWAVGSEPTSARVAAHWDGSQWVTVPTPGPQKKEDNSHLVDVAALSGDEAWAVGLSDEFKKRGYEPLIVRWDGAAWRAELSPSGQPSP